MDFKDEENKETAALMSDEVITKAVKDFQVSSKVHTIYSKQGDWAISETLFKYEKLEFNFQD